MTPASSATVKLFAALRDAADTAEVTVPAPASLADVLIALEGRFGERFAARLEIAAVMVDGVPVDNPTEVSIAPGAEIALLPPFAGG
ncbi:MoaD/ThiS family protein [Euzebya tangerina]|uniref:MoaD/ThiS family protein n=1 Tax=Euzebya tangerina TaxID=591198 RepID=UPI000E31C31F|nr:MoaD/ThiS family protein [Euzebya tangerina]